MGKRSETIPFCIIEVVQVANKAELSSLFIPDDLSIPALPAYSVSHNFNFQVYSAQLKPIDLL